MSFYKHETTTTNDLTLLAIPPLHVTPPLPFSPAPTYLWLVCSFIQRWGEKLLSASLFPSVTSRVFLHFFLNGLMSKHAEGQGCMLGLFCRLGKDCGRGRGRARWVLIRNRDGERGNISVCWLMSDRTRWLCWPVTLSLSVCLMLSQPLQQN